MDQIKIVKERNVSGERMMKLFHLQAVMPVSIYEEPTQIVIQYYPSVSSIIRKYLKKHKDNLLCEDSLEDLQEMLVGKYQKKGYEFHLCRGYKMVYSHSNLSSFILPNTKPLDDSIHNLDNEMDFPLEEYLVAQVPAYMTVIEDKVVSVAVQNSIEDESTIYLDIGVETAKEYRGFGYAMSNAAKLTQDLVEQNKKPYVQIEIENIPSQNLFSKLGYLKDSKYYHFVGEEA